MDAGSFFQLPFDTTNQALSDFLDNLVNLYEISNPSPSFRRNRQQLYTAALLYCESVHPSVLSLAEKFKYISRTSLEAMVFVSPALLEKVADDCSSAWQLADDLDKICQTVLRRLGSFANVLMQQREAQREDSKTQGGADELETGSNVTLKRHVQKGALDANDSAVLQLSVKRFDEAIQQIRGLVGDIRTAVTKIGGTVNSGEAIRALENAPSEMDVVKHAELTKMRKSITQDVDEFRMRWKDLIQTILSIEDSKSPEIVEDWGKEVVA